MSWDVELISREQEPEHIVGSWNHTSNCDRMIYAVLKDIFQSPPQDKSWTYLFDGQRVEHTSQLLDQIIERLDADPARFNAMEPANKWGSRASLVFIFKEMREKAKRYPLGIWEIRS